MLDALGSSDIDAGLSVPGVGCCAIPDTVALCQMALDIGAAGVLMLPPFYYKPVDDDGLFAAYAEIIERVGDSNLKILLYHIPQNTGVPITLDLIDRLTGAYPGTVVGIKDSAGDFGNMKATVEGFGISRLLGVGCLSARRPAHRGRRFDHRLQQHCRAAIGCRAEELAERRCGYVPGSTQRHSPCHPKISARRSTERSDGASHRRLHGARCAAAATSG